MRHSTAIFLLTVLVPPCLEGCGANGGAGVSSGTETADDAGGHGGGVATDSGASAVADAPKPSAQNGGSDASATCGYAPTDPNAPRNLMAAPIASDADAAMRFACLGEILTVQDDGRAPFVTLYAAITSKIMAGIAAGDFQDSVWAGEYLKAFAELYRQSFENYDTGNVSAVPQAWQIAFSTAAGKKALEVQNLALGVNAHIDRDLAYALQTVGIGDTVALRAERYSDHNTVNSILDSELSPALQKFATLYAPGFNEVPSAVLPVLEDTFFSFVVTGRQNAWDNAVSLVSTTGVAHQAAEDTIENEAVVDADAILSPSLSPALMAELHQLEGT